MATVIKIARKINEDPGNTQFRRLRKGNHNIDKLLECYGVESVLEELGFHYEPKLLTRDEKGQIIDVFTGWHKPVKENDTVDLEANLVSLQLIEQKIKEKAKLSQPLAR